jgi:amidase
VQVVTRPYQDEKAIGIMRLLDDALPPPAQRGTPWTNRIDPQGNTIVSSKANVGFGPGSLTRALFV